MRTRLHIPEMALCVILFISTSNAFVMGASLAKQSTAFKYATAVLRLGGRSYFDDDEEEMEREFAKVRRGGRRRNDEYEDDFEPDLYRKVDAFLSDKEANDDREDVGKTVGIIPNALLDSIDPEGAGERFPELIRDPKFWIDIGLFFLLLNFLDNIAVLDASPFGMAF